MYYIYYFLADQTNIDQVSKNKFPLLNPTMVDIVSLKDAYNFKFNVELFGNHCLIYFFFFI